MKLPVPRPTLPRIVACACVALAGLAPTSLATPARAEALKAAAVGCRAADDASKLATTPGRDKPQARAFVASGACIDFAKGITIDIDERKPPLACVRLTGDLSCYWMAASLVDDHPSEKGGGAKRQGGGGRRH